MEILIKGLKKFLIQYINQQNETKHNLFSLDVPESIRDLTLKVNIILMI